MKNRGKTGQGAGIAATVWKAHAYNAYLWAAVTGACIYVWSFICLFLPLLPRLPRLPLLRVA